MTEKYRAKRTEDGKWVAGTYFQIRLTSNDYIFHFIEVYGEMNGEKVRHKFSVKPDTLSRYSGLTACGQDVYEGDIIRFHIDHTAEFWTAVVRFGWHDTYEYGWYLEPIRDTVFTKAIGVWLGENPAFGSTAAVVGNVWDNPEKEGTLDGEENH